MSRAKKAFGWIEGGKVALSIAPRADKGPFNLYADPAAALADASQRKLSVVWEDAAAIDAFGKA